MRKQILVTNDDGVRSEGILALADALRRLGDVTIVAPLNEASAIGHALTLRRPLHIEKFGEGIFAVDGTPTDCVNIAVTKVLERMPDLVVSGINKGWNIGDDVTYSGTVAGALEGALLGVPSIAVSLQFTRGVFDFGPAASAAATYGKAVLERGLPARTLLNINLPTGPIRGFRVTVQGKRNHVTSVMDVIDPRQRVWYWIEEGQNDWEPHDRSDYQAVKDGFVSVTPLHPDLTHYEALKAVEALPIEAEVEVK
ncbi:MAG TPA: 5'/3'-nucleotidase SurE [Vicinamibacterales bacterium]